jgi:hypothetical protein
MERASKFTGSSTAAFIKFLGLVRTAALKGNGQDLGDPEIAMLHTLAQSWLAGEPLTVLRAMSANDQCSGTSSHRSLKLLRKKGYISLALNPLDNRVKAVLPTELAMRYFDVMGKCMAKAGV